MRSPRVAGLGRVAGRRSRLPLHTLPGGSVDSADVSDVDLGPAVTTKDSSFIDCWAKWNFAGYEGKPAYPEYYAIIQTMAARRDNGCGRAMWEHEEQHDRYGTPMALMLLPFWTNGCIGSMEGLYFEASATTPYHFLNQDELSTAPSNAQRDLPYDPGAPTADEFDLGVEHLQMLGREVLHGDLRRTMIDLGRRNPNLTEVATSRAVGRLRGRPTASWSRRSTNEPAVVDGASAAGKTWLDDTDGLVPRPRRAGRACSPPTARRVAADRAGRRRPSHGPSRHRSRCRTSRRHRRRIELRRQRRSACRCWSRRRTSRTGRRRAPTAPAGSAPNLMVVVPTEHPRVELHYGYTGVDYLGWLLTLLGLVGLVLALRGPRPDRRCRRQPSCP